MISLRCAIGLHSPMDGGVWNHGYCFTRCARCQRDMVKSVFGEWHVPRDFRVAWRAGPGAVTTFDAARQAAETGAVPSAKTKPSRTAARKPVAPPPPSMSERDAFWAAPVPGARAAREAAPSPFDFGDFDETAGPPPRAKAARS